MIDVIAFDGDDTLWHNMNIFSNTEEWYRALLAPYVPTDVDIARRLEATEIHNLEIFGYGIKGFTLSMIETAIEVTEGRVPASVIGEIIGRARWMRAHPVELLDGVREVVELLAGRIRLMIITKGDLLDQESKIARSGLADLFWKIEILSEKDASTYGRILEAHTIEPCRFLMIGNSMRSDILPILELGGHAVYVPYDLVWTHELVDHEVEEHPRLHELSSLAELPDLLRKLHVPGIPLSTRELSDPPRSETG